MCIYDLYLLHFPVKVISRRDAAFKAVFLSFF